MAFLCSLSPLLPCRRLSSQVVQDPQDTSASSLFVGNTTHVVINDALIELATPLSEEEFKVSV
jgi:hypothetical protein